MDIAKISQLLKQLLEVRSPETGARLKQRLNMALTNDGFDKFDERAFGCRKFSEFLEKTQSSFLRIDRFGDARDISVSLVDEGAPVIHSTESAAGMPNEWPIRSDIWQAFTNINPQRKRFFNKNNFELKHFLDGEQSSECKEVCENPDQFLEIEPVSSNVQQGWMRDYLHMAPIQDKDRLALKVLTEQSYSGNVNTAFTRALGQDGAKWRSFRAQRVTEIIAEWARRNDVPLERLRKRPMSSSLSSVAPQAESARARAKKMLDSIAEKDIERVIMPVLLTTLLVRASD